MAGIPVPDQRRQGGQYKFRSRSFFLPCSQSLLDFLSKFVEKTLLNALLSAGALYRPEEGTSPL